MPLNSINTRVSEEEDVSEVGDLATYQAVFFESLRAGQLFTTLFESIPEVYFFVKDIDCRFMSASRGFAKIMGVESEADLIGRTDHDFSPDFLADAFFKDDQQVFSTSKALYEKIELIPLVNGTLDWVVTTKIPLFDKDDQVVGLAGVARVIDDSASVYMNHPEMRLIVEFLKENFSNKIIMSDVAEAAKVSVSKLERLFKKYFGITPLMFLHKIRLNAACAKLRDTETDLANIAIECGFNDQTSMTRAFRIELKITPLKYRTKFREVVQTHRFNNAHPPLFIKF